jgi:UDP-N-acetylmuramoyl-tripeptide--D-alanyl-D-alanine ligase
MIRRVLTNLAAIYGPRAAGRLVTLYRQAGGPFRYLWRYWNTQQFTTLKPDSGTTYRPLRWLMAIGMFGEMLVGLALAITGIDGEHTAGLLVGVGIILAAPIVWAHVLFVLAVIGRLLQPKRYGKALLCSLLERQVRILREKNDMTVIAVAGSVGKTSTKLAIARTLEAVGKKVRYQLGNYNDRLTVPLVFFGAEEPGIFNIPAWLRILMNNQRILRQDYSAEIVVIELGPDGPNQMDAFAYLHPELCVVTAVSEEHMAFFGDLDTVAKEELKVFNYSSQLLVNTDDVPARYLGQDSYVSYGLANANFTASVGSKPTSEGQLLSLKLHHDNVELKTRMLGAQGAKVVLAAAAVAHMLEVEMQDLKAALETLQPFAGRMQLLRGVSRSTIIDDTYNASPVAVKAALDVLYAMEAPQRIAILGSMNEMGELSPSLHEQIGAYCDPDKLDLVVTVGADAKQYLAPAAKKAGCTVKSFSSPKKAGSFVAKEIKQKAVVLAKGSQNGVFTEEAVKQLLAEPADADKLVRQSDYWLNVKRSQFGG